MDKKYLVWSDYDGVKTEIFNLDKQGEKDYKKFMRELNKKINNRIIYCTEIIISFVGTPDKIK